MTIDPVLQQKLAAQQIQHEQRMALTNRLHQIRVSGIHDKLAGEFLAHHRQFGGPSLTQAMKVALARDPSGREAMEAAAQRLYQSGQPETAAALFDAMTSD